MIWHYLAANRVKYQTSIVIDIRRIITARK